MEEKEDKTQSVCWINEREKILSFHFEEGYVRKEFYSKEEFRTFIVSAASGGYKVQ